MALERSAIGWQQYISRALGCKPGQLTYQLEECIEKIEGLKPRTVNSYVELDALPVGSVVRELEDAPSVFEKVAYEEGETGWEMPGDLHWYTPGEITLPTTVLFTPGDVG